MEPAEPPPPYQEYASSGSASSSRATPSQPATTSKTRNGIPTQTRRSMEDENRDLPSGWIRQYDDKEFHHFFVDVSANPPRSIWHHPYDDEQYLSSLSASERSRVQSLHKEPPKADMESESSEHSPYAGYPELPRRPSGSSQSFGQRLKDKLTNSSHEEREAKKARRDEAERERQEYRQKFRLAMALAMQTGEPQFLQKDKDGRDVYVEPPNGVNRGYVPGAYGYNPYTQGPYSNPNARFLRPQTAYAQPGFGNAPIMGFGMNLM